MAIEVTENLSGPITVLALKGRITQGEASDRLRDRVALALHDAKWFKEKRAWSLCLILDMAGVEFMDSAGIGALVGVFASARQQQARVKLANLTEALRQRLIATKLATVFEIYSTVEEAKTSCGAAPAASQAEKPA